MLELRQTIVQALTASFEVSRRLQEAGNIADLDFARERALLEGGKLALRSVEVAVRQSREELNILMGLWGNQTEWQTEERLPEVPPQPIQTEDIERVALNRSLDLLTCPATSRVCRRTVGIEQVDCSRSGDARWRAWESGQMVHGTSAQRWNFPFLCLTRGRARISRAAVELERLSRSITPWQFASAPRRAPSATACKARGIARFITGTSCCRCKSAS